MIEYITIALLVLSFIILSTVITFVFFTLNKVKDNATSIEIEKNFQDDLKKKYDDMINRFNILKTSDSNILVEYKPLDTISTSNIVINNTSFPGSNIFIQNTSAKSGYTENINNSILFSNSNLIINSNIFIDGIIDSTLISSSNINVDGISLYYNNILYPTKINNDSFIIGNSNNNFDIYNSDKLVHRFKNDGDVYHAGNMTVDQCIYFNNDSNNKICLSENSKKDVYVNTPINVDRLEISKINLGNTSNYNTMYANGSNIYYSDNSGNVFQLELSSNV